MNLRTVFFGTPEYAVWSLVEMNQAGIIPTLVVTAPDSRRGRGMHMAAPPVKEWANENGIDVLQPERIRGNEEFMDELRNTEWDIFIVAAYGKILPKELLDMPKHGVLNIHPSLLPKFRGPNPIAGAILDGETETGVTIILLDEETDHGPILNVARISPEEPLDNFGNSLAELLFREGGRLLAETIPLWVKGKITPEEQDHSRATYTKMLSKSDGLIDPEGDAEKNDRIYRAFRDVWPHAYFFAEKGGKQIRVKVTEAEYTGNIFTIRKVIPEGKKEMAYEDFKRMP